MKINKICFIGGDMRIVHLIELFSNENIQINVIGFDKTILKECENIKICNTLAEAVENTDIILGPVPFSSNGQTINTPFNSSLINISDLIELMNSTQILIAGRIDSALSDLFNENNIRVIDILAREEFAVLNAISTAEGAIQLAMENSQYTLHNTPVLVIGFGRIGKILCKMLAGIGANVYCEARKYSDIAWIKAYGYTPIHINDLDDNISKFTLFINTVPFIMFNKDRINKMLPESFFIDLASRPGGIDMEYAKEKQINTMLALSLPGKVAPFTAAQHLKETIDNIFNEL